MRWLAEFWDVVLLVVVLLLISVGLLLRAGTLAAMEHYRHLVGRRAGARAVRKAEGVLKQVSRRQGFGFVLGSADGHLLLRGLRDGLAIRIGFLRFDAASQESPIIHVQVFGRPGRAPNLPPDDQPSEPEPAAWATPGFPLGEPRFDRRARLSGAPGPLAAALDHETRETALRLLEVCGEDEHGENHEYNDRPQCRLDLRFATDSAWASLGIPAAILSPARAMRAVEGLLALTQRLTKPRLPLAEALATNAARDPAPLVRLFNLRLLMRDLPASDITRQAAEAALSEETPAMRLAAGIHLGGERGLSAITALLGAAEVPASVMEAAFQHLVRHLPPERLLPMFEALLGAAEVPASVVGGAFQHLVRHLPPARLCPIFERALATEDETLRQTVVDVAIKQPEADRVRLLCRLAETADNRPSSLALVAALGASHDATVIPTLVRLLSSKHPRAVYAAAQSLGLVGGAAEIEPLLLLTSVDDMKEVAGAAIRRIRTRLGLGPVGAGQLSLTPSRPEAGALSLATAGGEVALAAPDDSHRTVTAAPCVRAPLGLGPVDAGELSLTPSAPEAGASILATTGGEVALAAPDGSNRTVTAAPLTEEEEGILQRCYTIHSIGPQEIVFMLVREPQFLVLKMGSRRMTVLRCGHSYDFLLPVGFEPTALGFPTVSIRRRQGSESEQETAAEILARFVEDPASVALEIEPLQFLQGYNLIGYDERSFTIALGKTVATFWKGKREATVCDRGKSKIVDLHEASITFAETNLLSDSPYDGIVHIDNILRLPFNGSPEEGEQFASFLKKYIAPAQRAPRGSS